MDREGLTQKTSAIRMVLLIRMVRHLRNLASPVLEESNEPTQSQCQAR